MFRLCVSALVLLLALPAFADEVPQNPPASVENDQAVSPSPAELGSNLSLRETTERGIAQFRQGDFDGAIESFTAAYVISPNPMFLFNIAQAHRKASRPKEALLNYQLFLHKAPDTPLRAETEAYIELVRTQLQVRQPPPAPPPFPPPPVVAAPPPLALPPTLTPPVEKPVPVYKRAVFWGLLGAAVAVATGVAVGVYLGTRPPSTTLGIIEPVF